MSRNSYHSKYSTPHKSERKLGGIWDTYETPIHTQGSQKSEKMVSLFRNNGYCL